MFQLSGKTALVTGGNKGIGRGIATALASAGAATHITGRDAAAAQSTLAAINAAGGQAEFHECDVNDTAGMTQLMQEITRDSSSGQLDILVNNAGIAQVDGPPETMSDEAWDSVLITNLSSVFRCCQAVHPLMQKNGGKIINIGSMYSLFGTPVIPNYAASKGGIVALTKSLATAWAAQNIQVNAILPGWISTDLTRTVEADQAFTEQIINRTPSGRFGQPEDLGGAAVFLAAPASNFVTGQSLAVCGGYSIS